MGFHQLCCIGGQGLGQKLMFFFNQGYRNIESSKVGSCFNTYQSTTDYDDLGMIRQPVTCGPCCRQAANWKYSLAPTCHTNGGDNRTTARSNNQTLIVHLIIVFETNRFVLRFNSFNWYA